jgi:hypothetical protein
VPGHDQHSHVCHPPDDRRPGMTEQPEEPAGWLVLDPDGHVVDSGGQTVTEASADAGEET